LDERDGRGTVGTFDAWDLTNNNNGGSNSAGYFLGSSTAGTGDINTNGVAFGIYANPSGAYADALRNFTVPLTLGQTFSIQVGVNFRNGEKGFSLENNGSEIFNFNVGDVGNGDDYTVNNVSLGLPYEGAAIFSLSLTQTTLTSGTWTILLDGSSFANNTGMYNGIGTGIKLYVSGTEAANNPADNLYFNSLAITNIPEPSSFALLGGPVLLGAYLFVRRRR
jgi:hypothetical protein